MADPHANPVHISKTVTILRKRPCPLSSSSSSPEVTATTDSTSSACFRGRDVAPLRHLIDRLEADVSSVHEQRQQAALRRVTDALNTPCPAGQFAAICVHTGTSGASGDSSTFDGVVRHIETTNRVNVVLLHPARHDSLRSISDTLTAAVDAITADAEEEDEDEEEDVDEQGEEKKSGSHLTKLIVGVELTHLFHPDLLSDLIYLLSHIHQSSPTSNVNNNKLSAAALFGISYANALHDCLNVGDMVMLRTTIVRMPTPYELFDGVVHVLSQRQGVVFNRSVFELLYTHFIQHDTSLSMVLRTLRQLITLHFSACPLADLLLLIDDNSESSRERVVKLLTHDDDTQSYLHLIDQLSSVRNHHHHHQANNGDKNTAQTFARDDDKLRGQQYAQCLYDLCKWKRNIAKLNAFTLQLDAIVDAKNVVNGNGNSTNAAAQLHQYHCQDESSSVQNALTFASFLPHHNAQTQVPGAVYLAKAQKFIRTAQRAELKRILTAIVDHFGTTSSSNKSGKPIANTSKAAASWFNAHADLSAQQGEDEVFATRAIELMSLLETNSVNGASAIGTPTRSAGNHNNVNGSITTPDTSPQMLTPKTPQRHQLMTNSPNPTPTPTSSISRRRATGAQAARALRNQLLRTNVAEAQQQQKLLPIGNVRDGVSRLLHEMFTRQKCLYMLPCHEVVLFFDLSALQVAGGGLCSTIQPRHAIFTALRTPSKVFPLLSKLSQRQHALRKADDDDVMDDDIQESRKKNSIPPVPDIVVAFRILAQGGRLVSLYDWYHTFASSISATHIHAQQQQKQDEQSDEHVNITIAELQARFARACSELELLGLLKYTNRKTDHVARLAYE